VPPAAGNANIMNLSTLSKQTPDDSAPKQSANIFSSFLERPVVAAVTVALVLAVGLPLAWFLGAPTYYAECVVYVSPTFIRNLAGDKEQEELNRQYNVFVEQQVHAVTRFSVMEETLKRLSEYPEIWRKPHETEQRAAERLQHSLIIRWIPDTYQITVGLQSKNRAAPALIANTVVDVFLQMAKADQFFGRDERVERLTDEKHNIEADLDANSALQSALSRSLGVVSPTSQESNPYDRLILRTREALAVAHEQRIEAESKLTAMTSLSSLTANDGLSVEAGQAAAADPEVDALKRELGRRRGELLSKISGLAPANPSRIAMERELRELDNEIQKTTGAITNVAGKMIRARMDNDVMRTRHVEERLQKELDQLVSQTDKVSLQFRRASELANERTRLQARLTVIEDRIAYLNLEASAPGFLRVYQSAHAPGPPTGGRKKYALVAFAAALLLGLLVPYGFELNWRRVRKASQVEQLLGFPPLGQLTLAEGGEVEAAFAEEQFQRLISAIERSRREWNLSRVLFIGVGTTVGVRSMVERIGRVLGERSLKVLVINAGSIAPQTRLLRQLPETPAESAIPVAVQTNCVTVSVFNSQNRLPLGTELTNMMQRLSQPYDLVLINSPTPTSMADTELLVSVTDATVLTVEAGEIKRKTLERTARWLERLRAPAVGVVMTHVSLTKGGLPLRRAFAEFQAAMSSSVAGPLFKETLGS